MTSIDNIVSEVVKDTLAYTRAEWEKEAKNKLKTSRMDYLMGLSSVKMEGSTKGRIDLVGAFPIMTETGYSGFDIKDGFKNSPKRKKKKNGWYLTIPYRHYTNSSSPTGMPPEIMKNAKKLGDRETLKEALVRELGFEPQTSFTGYKWKNSKYDNLQRIIKTYPSGKVHSTYMTFRRVSNNTDPKAWQHPGYRGLKAMDTIERKSERFFYEALESRLE